MKASDLPQAAQFLRNAAPREFDHFRSEFEKYDAECVDKIILATINLEQVQGQLQQCRTLLNMLKDIK